MTDEKKLLTTDCTVFTSLTEDTPGELTFPVRSADNKKIEIADLFMHFTANIIREDVLFTR